MGRSAHPGCGRLPGPAAGRDGGAGLYILGLDWLHTAKSGLFAGVGEDAAYLAAQIAERIHSDRARHGTLLLGTWAVRRSADDMLAGSKPSRGEVDRGAGAVLSAPLIIQRLPAKEHRCPLLYELYAVKYAERMAPHGTRFYGGDPHDGPTPMDFFLWAAVSPEHTVVVDCGFTAETAARRHRRFLRTPAEGLRALGIDERASATSS